MQIYKIINLLNNKIYIGKDTKNWKNYFGSGIIIKNAIKKYGRENFKKEILEECKTKDELCDREIFWINKLNSIVPNGYNLTCGGDGGNTALIDNPNEKEIRHRMSKAQKLRFENKKEREKISKSVSGKNNGMYGRKHKPETIEKMKKKRLEQCKDKKHVERISIGIKKSIKNMPKYKCTFCGKFYNKRILNQYHKNGKCKLN